MTWKIVVGVGLFACWALMSKLLAVLAGAWFLRRERARAVAAGRADRPLLTTISFSHFCEKARFALDAVCGAAGYEEDAHLPILHMLWALLRTSGASSSTPAVHDRTSGRVIVGSSAILQWLSAQYPQQAAFLYPAAQRAEIEQWEALLDRDLGPHIRRVLYFHMLQQPTSVTYLFQHGRVPRWEAWLGQALFPAFRFLISRGLRINAQGYAASLQKVNSVFDQVDHLLADGRPYMCGTSIPSAADVTLASLSILMQPEMPRCAGYPPFDEKHIGKELFALISTLRRRPAGQLALKVYQSFRSNPKRLSTSLSRF